MLGGVGSFGLNCFLYDVHWLFLICWSGELLRLVVDDLLMRESIAFAIGPALALDSESEVQQIGL